MFYLVKHNSFFSSFEEVQNLSEFCEYQIQYVKKLSDRRKIYSEPPPKGFNFSGVTRGVNPRPPMKYFLIEDLALSRSHRFVADDLRASCIDCQAGKYSDAGASECSVVPYDGANFWIVTKNDDLVNFWCIFWWTFRQNFRHCLSIFVELLRNFRNISARFDASL